MAQISYRANLSSAIFPLSLSKVGTSVIIPQADNHYDRRVDPEGEQKNAGIPQSIYMDNVVPTVEGYQSVGKITKASITLGAVDRYIAGVVEFPSSSVVASGLKIAIVEGLAGYNEAYVNNAQVSTAWTTDAPSATAIDIAPAIASYDPSTFELRGTLYMFVDTVGSKLYTVTFGISPPITYTDISGSVTGLTLGDVRFMLASHNYMIAVKGTGEVCWSSTTTPTDFTPSLVTGAGTATPNDIRGRPVCAYNTSEGFILYTTEGCITATYTGNARYPFKFKELLDSGKYSSSRQVHAKSGEGYHYAVDDNGLIRIITSNSATLVAPELCTWTRQQNVKDTYNVNTDTLSSTVNPTYYRYRIKSVLSKYIFLEVIENSDFADCFETFVFDVQLRRYGKLRFSYKFCWDYQDSVYFLAENGTCFAMTFDVNNTDADFSSSVLLLGKFQYVRSRRLELHELTLVGTYLSAGAQGISVAILPSDNGHDFRSAELPYNDTSGSSVNCQKYMARSEGQNITVAIKGRFSLNTAEMVFNTGAGR